MRTIYYCVEQGCIGDPAKLTQSCSPYPITPRDSQDRTPTPLNNSWRMRWRYFLPPPRSPSLPAPRLLRFCRFPPPNASSAPAHAVCSERRRSQTTCHCLSMMSVTVPSIYALRFPLKRAPAALSQIHPQSGPLFARRPAPLQFCGLYAPQFD